MIIYFFAAISSQCAILNCDDDCEVVAVTGGNSLTQAFCLCTIGYMRVRVAENFKCSSEFKKFLGILYGLYICEIYIVPLQGNYSDIPSPGTGENESFKELVKGAR